MVLYVAESEAMPYIAFPGIEEFSFSYSILSDEFGMTKVDQSRIYVQYIKH